MDVSNDMFTCQHTLQFASLLLYLGKLLIVKPLVPH